MAANNAGDTSGVPLSVPAVESDPRVGDVRDGAAGADGDVEVAELDQAGVIVWVNDAWRDFCVANGGDLERAGVGMSYLEVCDGGEDDGARDVAAAIRTAIAGDLPAPLTVRVPCDAPDEPRWFDVLISSRLDADGAAVGAIVTLSRASSSDVARTQPQTASTHQPGSQPEAARHRLGAEEPEAGWGAARSPDPDLSFPDLPRTELEHVIGELTARAQGVLNAQGRLRALLRANAAVASDLSLPIVLRHIVTAARDLVEARYAALGVVGADGTLEEFVHVGMDTATVERVGELPRGQGILGMLISHPEPVRLTDLKLHPASVGFPNDHPPMGSFLGVPIRVRDQVFGNLYLTESDKGEFSVEDEQLVVALAASAGVAIDNARLHQQTERQRQWLSASTEVTQQLFAGASEQPLDVVLDYALRGAEADLANLVLPAPGQPGNWMVEAAVGAHAEAVVGRMVDSGSVIADVVAQGKPVLIDDYATRSRSISLYEEAAGDAARIGSAICAPLLDGDTAVGVLSVARLAGGHVFTEADMDLLAGFASHAGVALQLADAQRDREALHLAQEHDRIAGDLHDHVIQELFATGMGLEGMVHVQSRAEHRTRLLGYVDALDATIRRIRATIFSLQHPGHLVDSLRQRLIKILDDEAPALGFSAHIEFAGPLDLTVPAALADDATAVVREALSNIARHAHAHTATVRVALANDTLTIEITDDGDGIGTPTRSSGLANLRHRAEKHHGAFSINDHTPHGTRLVWTARTNGH